MSASGLGDPGTNTRCVTSRVTGVNGRPHRPVAALTIATMPAFRASGSSGHADTTAARAGSGCSPEAAGSGLVLQVSMGK